LPDATFRRTIPSKLALSRCRDSLENSRIMREDGLMSMDSKYLWIAASLSLVMGAGELVAYQGIAPHARKLRNPGRVVLRAGAVVARDLSALVAERAGHVASRVALRGVEQTTRLYRVAGHALGLELDAVPAGNTDPACRTVIASEPDQPCDPGRECETAVRAVEIACPACPACPTRAEVSRVVERSVRHVTRRIVIRV